MNCEHIPLLCMATANNSHIRIYVHIYVIMVPSSYQDRHHRALQYVHVSVSQDKTTKQNTNTHPCR